MVALGLGRALSPRSSTRGQMCRGLPSVSCPHLGDLRVQQSGCHQLPQLPVWMVTEISPRQGAGARAALQDAFVLWLAAPAFAFADPLLPAPPRPLTCFPAVPCPPGGISAEVCFFCLEAGQGLSLPGPAGPAPRPQAGRIHAGRMEVRVQSPKPGALKRVPVGVFGATVLG